MSLRGAWLRLCETRSVEAIQAVLARKKPGLLRRYASRKDAATCLAISPQGLATIIDAKKILKSAYDQRIIRITKKRRGYAFTLATTTKINAR